LRVEYLVIDWAKIAQPPFIRLHSLDVPQREPATVKSLRISLRASLEFLILTVSVATVMSGQMELDRESIDKIFLGILDPSVMLS
jgi:hypothetical protein